MKLITVIVPVYNVENYLSKCIESIMEQSYKNLEIILVDDGSNDNSLAIRNSFSQKDDRVKVYHTKNLGLSNARNVGLDHANGEYVTFIDSDDYVHKDMIKTMINKIGNADLVICNYEKVLSDSNEQISQDQACLKDEYWSPEQFWQHYYWRNLHVFCCVAWNKLYKLKLFNNVRYPISMIHEDEYIINNLINNCQKIKVIKDSLYYYVQRQGSIMHNAYRGYFEIAEAFLGRCSSFHEYHSNNIIEENLNEIPRLLALGFNEAKNQNNVNEKYNLLRKKYNFFLKQYLRKNFSIKLYLKFWMLKVPKLYSLYLKNFLK